MMDLASRFSKILEKIKILDKGSVSLTVYAVKHSVRLTELLNSPRPDPPLEFKVLMIYAV
jgi:hypothetical protein